MQNADYTFPSISPKGFLTYPKSKLFWTGLKFGFDLDQVQRRILSEFQIPIFWTYPKQFRLWEYGSFNLDGSKRIRNIEGQSMYVSR